MAGKHLEQTGCVCPSDAEPSIALTKRNMWRFGNVVSTERECSGKLGTRRFRHASGSQKPKTLVDT
jgi:hypothetical protein